MPLSERRQEEIALKYLRYKMRKEGTGSLEPNNMRRRILETSKAIGISDEEGIEFARLMLQQAVDSAFANPPRKNGSQN